jgi:hypothetical protein
MHTQSHSLHRTRIFAIRFYSTLTKLLAVILHLWIGEGSLRRADFRGGWLVSDAWQVPTKFELVINLKTAKALGSRDEVIE